MSKGTNAGDDWIRAVSSMTFVNTFLKYCVLILSVCLIIALGVIFYLGSQISEFKPLPIFVDKSSGTARAVDFKSIDASGENRIEAEINSFANDFIGNLYTYNRFTIKANLEKIFAVSTSEVINSIKSYWQMASRADYIRSGYQGLVDIQSVIVQSSQPDLQLQMRFTKKIVGNNGEKIFESSVISIMRIKPVVRSDKNAHGLVVVEYRESEIKTEKGEVK